MNEFAEKPQDVAREDLGASVSVHFDTGDWAHVVCDRYTAFVHAPHKNTQHTQSMVSVCSIADEFVEDTTVGGITKGGCCLVRLLSSSTWIQGYYIIHQDFSLLVFLW